VECLENEVAFYCKIIYNFIGLIIDHCKTVNNFIGLDLMTIFFLKLLKFQRSFFETIFSCQGKALRYNFFPKVLKCNWRIISTVSEDFRYTDIPRCLRTFYQRIIIHLLTNLIKKQRASHLKNIPNAVY